MREGAREGGEGGRCKEREELTNKQGGKPRKAKHRHRHTQSDRNHSIALPIEPINNPNLPTLPGQRSLAWGPLARHLIIIWYCLYNSTTPLSCPVTCIYYSCRRRRRMKGKKRRSRWGGLDNQGTPLKDIQAPNSRSALVSRLSSISPAVCQASDRHGDDAALGTSGSLEREC